MAEDGTLVGPAYAVADSTYHSVGSAFTALNARVNGINTRVDTLEKTVAAIQKDVQTLNANVRDIGAFTRAARTEARYGIASAMAMASAPLPSAPGRTSWAFNLADFKGYKATGFAMAHRLDTEIPVAVTGAITYSADTTAFRVGLAGEF